ncbi:MAG: serine protease [Verrucomicrobiales bacterium]|nr:serine protease [Verrucomicrobiales bacterium]
MLKSVSISSSGKALFLSLLLAFALASVGKAEEAYISDEAFSAAFTRECSALIANKQHVEGEVIRTELKRELRFSQSLSPASPLAPADNNGGNPVRSASAATLIVGHLYLCGKCDKWHNNLAGGVLISSGGLLVTNYHVLKFAQAKTFAAMTRDGRIFPIKKVLASSEKDDLALVQLAGAKDLPFVPIAPSAATGDALFVISHPDAHFYTFTRGHVSRYFLEPKGKAKRIQITAPFARGSSGSGIFNENGGLIGIATFTNTIFYEPKTSGNPQAVLYTGVPSASILSLGTD